MKKKILISSLIAIVVGWGAYLFTINRIVNMTKNYEPYTFERVLEDSLMRINYGLTTQSHPADYGYENVEEVSFKSALDKLTLNAWYVNSAPNSIKTIVLVHGRTSNRLKTMKYLQLFKETGLDTLYNFFIPDLRNSGKSSEAPTYMGYKFAEDILGALYYLDQYKSQDQYVIYAFSMGAMATSTMLDRKDLKKPKRKIKKLIFDSPLADVKGNIKKSAREMGLPNFIFESAFKSFSEEMGGYGQHMKFGLQLKNVNIPILIIQSNDDKTTPSLLTKVQLYELDGKPNIQSWFMDGPEHVQIFTSEDYRQQYTDRVTTFIGN